MTEDLLSLILNSSRDQSSGMKTRLVQNSLRDHCWQGVLTAHLLLQPVFEYCHTGVDPRLPWLPTAIPPRGDSKEDLSGVRARLGTG